MSQQPISIIGAGIGGRVLGQALKRMNIPATIFEKSAASRYAYGITIQEQVFKRLRKDVLGQDDIPLRKRVTVDAPDGFGLVYPHRSTDFSARVHRQKFEEVLGDGLDIQYGHELDSIDTSEKFPEISFTNGKKVSGSVVVAFDGVHSKIRTSLLPNVEPNVLPYVAINGKCRVERATYDKLYDPAILRGNVISTRKGDAALQISINEGKTGTDLVSISFVYSRPARSGGEDPLYDPDRPKDKANHIPQAFFDEIAALKDLEQPYSDVFDVKKLEDNKTLISWLMRTVEPPLVELKELGNNNVLLAGDAIHAQPILGGLGANAAITDAIELADILSGKDLTTETFNAFYESVWMKWSQDVSDSVERIGGMHLGRSPL
ncbi:Eukaryotic translation initiation factor 3 subunit G [Venturia nashicola]|nr:Eukaryotic translation initiation factor 3 subunit G [Venturia nashicola]